MSWHACLARAENILRTDTFNVLPPVCPRVSFSPPTFRSLVFACSAAFVQKTCNKDCLIGCSCFYSLSAFAPSPPPPFPIFTVNNSRRTVLTFWLAAAFPDSPFSLSLSLQSQDPKGNSGWVVERDDGEEALVGVEDYVLHHFVKQGWAVCVPVHGCVCVRA